MDHRPRLRVLLTVRGSAEAEAGRLARSLRDSGHEVVFLGEEPTANVVAAIAEQEDVDATCRVAPSRVDVQAEDRDVRRLLEDLAASDPPVA